jgi:hypothetical protein
MYIWHMCRNFTKEKICTSTNLSFIFDKNKLTLFWNFSACTMLQKVVDSQTRWPKIRPPTIHLPEYLSTRIFVNPNICQPKYLLTRIFIDPNIRQPKYSLTWIFLAPLQKANIRRPSTFSEHKFSLQEIFWMCTSTIRGRHLYNQLRSKII